jgi:hypothetical protein
MRPLRASGLSILLLVVGAHAWAQGTAQIRGLFETKAAPCYRA